jgi:hypothetical protein
MTIRWDSLEHLLDEREEAIEAQEMKETGHHINAHDALGVLDSTGVVVDKGYRVSINYDCLFDIAELLRDFPEEPGQSASTNFTWYDRYHFSDGTERTLNWLLLLDALNFCFWPDKGQERWRIDYHGETPGGYWAEAAALTRAVEEGFPVWDARYLSELSRDDLRHILRGVPSQQNRQPIEIPLLEARLANAREVGQVLLARYDGRFANVIEEAGGSAVKLALLLAEHFPSFRDIATFRGQEVRFLKRAQICASDVHGSFRGEGWGRFHDLDQLTVFADYKLPQILRHYGALFYDYDLEQHIDNQELLAAGGEEEVQIRANTIWACELLRHMIAADAIEDDAPDEALTAAEIDARLWLLAQDTGGMLPYHRVRTIYY